MSYTPTLWIDGETPVNAENLNKLENAVQTNDLAINEINTARESGEFKGDPGYTPQKGTDYYTEADKAEMVKAVQAAVKLPGYVVAEAEEVIEKVITAQGNRTFTIAAITDMHYGNDSYTDGVPHACKALKYIDSRIKLDAVAVLGDYTDGMAASTFTGAASDCKEVNAVLDGLRVAPNFRLAGNHDFHAKHSPIMHRYIQAYSDDVTWGSKLGGYFYRDFEGIKLRVICLNTAEENKDGLSCTAEQYNWFIGALDLSGKSDATEWQTLILSHHPLDWFYSNDSGYVFWQILNAYLGCSSWSNTAGTISCNFVDKNSAAIIGNIHGHTHNLMVRNISAGQPNTTASTIGIVRVATPEACYGRENIYSGTWDYNPFGEDTTYPKTQGTADETSFCIYCIDLDTKTINAICYGAGYDRTVEYDGSAITEPINWLWNGIGTDGAIYNNGAGWKDGYRLNSSGVEGQYDGMSVTGFISVKVGDVVTVENAVAGSNTAYLHFYDSSFSRVSGGSASDFVESGTVPNITFTVTNENAAYFRYTARFYQNSGSNTDTVITIS